jgi:hypothetical protein
MRQRGPVVTLGSRCSALTVSLTTKGPSLTVTTRISLSALPEADRIRLEGRAEKAQAALAVLEQVWRAVEDERLDALAAVPRPLPSVEVFSGLDCLEKTRWEELTRALGDWLTACELPFEASLDARLDALLKKPRVNWRPRWLPVLRREGDWVRIDGSSFNTRTAELLRIDGRWAIIASQRVRVRRLRRLQLAVPEEAAPEVVPVVPAEPPTPVGVGCGLLVALASAWSLLGAYASCSSGELIGRHGVVHRHDAVQVVGSMLMGVVGLLLLQLALGLMLPGLASRFVRRK